MDQATITSYTQRGLRNPRFSSTDITAMTLLGVHAIGNLIKSVVPSYYRGRQIATSNTHIFDWPSDCQSILTVHDTRTNATAITDATNASPINIEAVDHGLEDDDIVLITGVGGNTAANSTWKVTNVDDDNVTLNDSTGNAVYTSGGYILKWSSSFRKMTKKEPIAQTLMDQYKWFPEAKTVVVDYVSFSYDLIIDYIQRPDAITDIPSEYHMGLVGWNVINLLKIPEPESPDYQDLTNAYQFHKGLFDATVASIQATLRTNTEPIDLNDCERWDLL